MATVRTIAWARPAVSANQRALKFVRVEYRVKADVGQPDQPWSKQDEVAPTSEQKLDIQDPAPGTFQYRLTSVDVAGVLCVAPVIVEKTRNFDPPSSPGAVTVTDAG